MSLRSRYQQFREEWAAAGDAIERAEAARRRKDARAAKTKPATTRDDAAIIAANVATVAADINTINTINHG